MPVSGGIGKKHFKLLNDTLLPDSFSLTEDGIVTCAPQASESGLYVFHVEVTDESGKSARQEVELFIAGILKVEPIPESIIRITPDEEFSIHISASGGFSNQFQYRTIQALPEGVQLYSNDDFTGTLTGCLPKGNYRVVLEVDEAFSGSPVSSVVVYNLIVV